MNRKLYVQGNESAQKRLRDYIKSNPDSKSLQRAQAILWSMEGRDRSELSALFGVKKDTISDWFKRWNPDNLITLKDDSRSGRPPTLSSDEKKTF